MSDVRYIATIDVGMATTNPQLTETKVNKQTLQNKGITVVKKDELIINNFIFIYLLLRGYSISCIIEKKTGYKYTFDHKLNEPCSTTSSSS
jgi:hypothetical protein